MSKEVRFWRIGTRGSQMENGSEPKDPARESSVHFLAEDISSSTALQVAQSLTMSLLVLLIMALVWGVNLWWVLALVFSSSVTGFFLYRHFRGWAPGAFGWTMKASWIDPHRFLLAVCPGTR
ncbi:hypothetical protein ACFL0I_00110 [Gemmatimonadota bacterium]